MTLKFSDNLKVSLLIFFWIVFNIPKISLIQNCIKIIIWEFLHLCFCLTSNITRGSKSLGKNRFTNNWDIFVILEDKTTSSECSEQRWDKDDIRFNIIDMLSGIDTLVDTFFSYVTVDEIRVVSDSKKKLFVFTELFPNIR